MATFFLFLADWFLVVFHCVFILLVVFGWILKKTRKAQLWAVGLTVFSWFGLGIFFGFGYCPLTDLHWWVLEERGTPNLPRSYTQYLAQKILGLDLPASLIDVLTGIGFGIGLIGGIIQRLRKKRLKGA